MDSLLGRPFEILPSLVIAVAVIVIALLARLATDVSSSWYLGLRKPTWQPPNWVFGPAWAIIYIAFIASAILAWHSTGGSHRTSLMVLYGLNGALNVAWSFIFFRSRSPLVAAFDITGLLLTILWIMVRVLPMSPVAMLLLLPYLAWVAFATALNWWIVKAN